MFISLSIEQSFRYNFLQTEKCINRIYNNLQAEASMWPYDISISTYLCQ